MFISTCYFLNLESIDYVNFLNLESILLNLIYFRLILQFIIDLILIRYFLILQFIFIHYLFYFIHP
jgi:hypothetical protein